MKRLIALLLSLLFVLAACAQTNDGESSSTDDSSASGNSQIIEGAKETIVSQGAFYASASAPSNTYPDNFGAELTDGMDVSNVVEYSDASLVGYNKNATIVVDLGEKCDKIYAFAVSYFAHDGDGVSSNITVDVAYSENNVKWTACALFKSSEPEMDKVNTVKGGASGGYKTARYIRFKISGDAANLFLAELQVIADVEPKPVISYLDRVNTVYENLGVITPPAEGADVDTELNKLLISKGCTYTISGESEFISSGDEEDLTTKETVLTDGKTPGSYDKGTYVNIKGDGNEAKITVDLGRVTPDIGVIEANFMSNPASRVHLPLALKVVAIDENNNRTDLGVLYGTQVAKIGGFTFTLPFKKTVSARYIEFSMTTVDGMSHFVEEVAVYCYRDALEQSAMYPPVIIEKGEVGEKDGATSKYKNLLYGKTQQVFMPANGTAEANAKNNTMPNSPVLTDGFYSTVGNAFDIHNGKFFKFNAGDSRHIIYDLGNLSAVDKFTASFCQEISWGIYAPETVSVLLSANGEDWYDAGSFKLYNTQYNGILRGELKLPKAVQVRYVVFTFGITQWAGCDELEAHGTETIAGSVALDASGIKLAGGKGGNGANRIEPSADLLDGAKDLCLLYHAPSFEGYTVSDLLPYVAYLDAEGEIKDTMFDSFLFLHGNTAMPSGAFPYERNVMTDWQWVMDDLFKADANLTALEAAAGQVKSTLGLAEDFTYKITISINYPHKNATDFGDVDGDGISEDLSVYANRVKVCKWFIDEVNERFQNAGFKNIELVGYYWWHEQIDNLSDPDSVQLIKDTADYIHSIGYQFTWIPYFKSSGYDTWAELGFDVACMQPNYVFNLKAPYSNIVDCDKYTKELGMGVEMEIDSPCLYDFDFFKRYMQYISSGAELGYMTDTVIMYYQGYTIFSDAAYSGTYFGRTVYDCTYHFIKEDLKNVPDTIVGTKFEGEANKPVVGKIETSEDKMYEFELVTMPENGTVSIGDDGSFVFYPAKDYKGEFTFEFRYSELLSWSEPCTVTITVK